MNDTIFTRILFVLLLVAPVITHSAGQGYAWVDRQNTTKAYQTNVSYSWNSTNQAITASRTGTGTYSVNFTGLGGNGKPGGHAQVNAYGPGNAYCKVNNWDSKNRDFIVNVHCFTPEGQAVNSRFVVRVEWPTSTSAATITPENSRFFDAPDNIMSRHQTRSIDDEGRVIINYSDGRVMERFLGGTTTILPNGQRVTSLEAEIRPENPAGEPSNTEKTWLLKHNESLYEIIKFLVNNNEQALENYKIFEGRDKSVYDTIISRQKTISFLTRP